MKKIYFLFLMALLPLLANAVVKRTINVATAGTLPDLISDVDKHRIQKLTLTGELNGTDIKFIREMAGDSIDAFTYVVHYFKTNGRLVSLDISNCKIVEGGAAYYWTKEYDKNMEPYLVGYKTEQNSISDYMFGSLSSSNLLLKEIILPNSVTSIGDYAFYGCNGMTSVTIPDGVTSIGFGAFSGTPWIDNQPDGIVYVGKVLYCYKGTMPEGTKISIKKGTLGIAGGAFNGYSGLISVTIPNSVTSIGNGAFCGCSGLTSVTIPNSVTSIGNAAFSGCSGLTSITIPNSVISIGYNAFSGTAWYDQKSDGVVYAGKVLYKYKGTMPEGTKISIKDGTLGIADEAFSYCSGLTSVTIPNSMTYIGDDAFWGCISLASVSITNLASWCRITFHSSKSNPYSSKSNPLFYAHHLFLNGKEIKDLVIPNSVTDIRKWAFCGCSGLTSVTIPNSVTYIGDDAFEDCSGLTSVHITDLASWCKISFGRSFSNPLFYAHHLYLNDKEIKDLVIPNSVTTIGERVFWGCSGLTSLTIPNSVTSIGYGAFSGCSGLTSMIIPNSVTSIGDYAFQSCSSLKSVAVPNTLKSIGNGVFAWSGLTSVTIPSSVTSIGDYAFHGCSGLSTIMIGNGINKISNYAFANCVKLSDVYCYAENVPGTDIDAFNDSYIEYATLHVPVSSVDAYKAAEPWSGFKSKVKIAAKVKLSKSETTIEKGKTVTLKATITPSTLLDKCVTWKSSNTKVATVTSKGKVKGIKAGTATITCTSKLSGTKATCKVTVINGTVTLNKTEAIIEKGKTTTLKATLTPTTLEDMSVTWTSSDKSIATVTSKGKVKGVGYGTATITCTSKATGASATCKVTVGKVVMNSPEFTLRKSRTMTLIATVYPTTLTDKSVTWTSSDKSVATVTSSGKVKGIKAGTVTITCTSVATGLKGTCTVTVLATSESRSTDGNDDNVTGIKELEENSVATEPYDVYDLSGRKVLNQTTTLDGLPAGVYIVNGHKVLKK